MPRRACWHAFGKGCFRLQGPSSPTRESSPGHDQESVLRAPEHPNRFSRGGDSMRIRRLTALLGLAVALTLAAGQHAQAAFDVSILSTIVAPAGGTVVGSGGNSAVTISSPITNPVVQSAAPPSGTDFVMANIQATD